MLKETVALEELRQKIEKANYESGSLSDYLDRGRPNEREQKSAQAQIAKLNQEAADSKTQLHTLIGKTPKEAVEEWVNWHRGILQAILLEPTADAMAKTRIHVATNTLEEWNKVLRGEQDYVGINWYYLKDYKAKAEQEFKKGWKFWK